MAFVYERYPNEEDLEKLRVVFEKCKKYFSSKSVAFTVDHARDLFMVCFSVGLSPDKWVEPGEYVLAVGDMIVPFGAAEYGLFCDFEKKARGIEYRVLVPELPPPLQERRPEVLAWIKEALESRGYSQSTQWTTITEVRVTFIDTLRQFNEAVGPEGQA